MKNPIKKPNFYDFTMPKLAEFLVEKGYEKFRAKQLFRWVYGLKITDPALMTNVARTLREELPEILDLSLPKMVSHLVSTDGTQKFLYDIGGDTVETVLIPADERMTLCISSEVGCNMACRFCYTGKQKMKRRLTTSEIMGQYLGALSVLKEGVRISNIVFMGMGEPLDNPDAVFTSIENLHSPDACNLSRKKITVSTSGIVPLMPLITKAKVRLAVSLNAVNDEVRSYIMPINKKWPLSALLKACKEYCDETGDRVTFEYVLLKGVTDSIQDARDLFLLTKDIPCKINIIPFNEHPGSGFERPEEQTVGAFQNELIRFGAHVLRRKTMGRDIFAACGQLRSAHKTQSQSLENNSVAIL
jgi:23S rRNA (adenine2503-C2)-methyltransferase